MFYNNNVKNKRYREANRENIRARQKLYYEANKEKCNASILRWQKANREKVLATGRRYDSRHREKRREKHRRWRWERGGYAKELVYQRTKQRAEVETKLKEILVVKERLVRALAAKAKGDCSR